MIEWQIGDDVMEGNVSMYTQWDENIWYSARFEALRAMLLKIQGVAGCVVPWRLMALQSFEMQWTTRLPTQCNIPEELNHQRTYTWTAKLFQIQHTWL
jgi:hypothetical protein